VLEDVDEGQLVYTHEPYKQKVYTDQELANLSPEKQEEIRHFAPKIDGERWTLSHDEIIYCNHARPGNITNKDDKLYATKELAAGAELTQDYTELEGGLRSERNLR
jgi:hypothetical protein